MNNTVYITERRELFAFYKQQFSLYLAYNDDTNLFRYAFAYGDFDGTQEQWELSLRVASSKELPYCMVEAAFFEAQFPEHVIHRIFLTLVPDIYLQIPSAPLSLAVLETERCRYIAAYHNLTDYAQFIPDDEHLISVTPVGPDFDAYVTDGEGKHNLFSETLQSLPAQAYPFHKPFLYISEII